MNMNKEEILKALKILNIKSNQQLISNDLDYWWQIKFKQIQSNKKFTPLKKESLLIELNSARENLEDYEIDKLRELLPKIQSKSKQDLKKSDKKKEVLNDNGRIAINTKSKKGKALIPAAISVFSIFIAGLIIFDQSADYRTSNNKPKDTFTKKIEKNNSTNQKVYETVNYSDGGKYIGYRVNGKRHGFGIYYYSNGNIYEGDWVESNRTGQGVLYVFNGDKYKGGFLNGKFNGWGVWEKSNGDRYEGFYKNNYRHGKGTFTWINGQKYVGDFAYGEMHGWGIYTWPDGLRYEGKFLNGRISE